jgi:hypothetical protein
MLLSQGAHRGKSYSQLMAPPKDIAHVSSMIAVFVQVLVRVLAPGPIRIEQTSFGGTLLALHA